MQKIKIEIKKHYAPYTRHVEEVTHEELEQYKELCKLMKGKITLTIEGEQWGAKPHALKFVKNAKSANDAYGGYNEGEQLYKHSLFFKHAYTASVRQMAQECSAYWIIDLIFSHQIDKKVKAEPLQVWEIFRIKNEQFKAVCLDTNGNKITSQAIGFSDFKYDRVTLCLQNNVLFFPNQ